MDIRGLVGAGIGFTASAIIVAIGLFLDPIDKIEFSSGIAMVIILAFGVGIPVGALLGQFFPKRKVDDCHGSAVDGSRSDSLPRSE